ncbi:hypothetical protein KIN20_029232 [Parelaphostrongylus tenuis]|uniref:Uncharacterized protein n=1 Tax=Parelaphostrongylus tenuis TaxID=148309 RepID=A0AAD5R2V5_PARTN|nr:hypothetical protein KIN20_029232 [Parelaphostrongylus tenuis]
MLVLPVWIWVTVWSLSVHYSKAVFNSTLKPTDMVDDYTIERSVQLAHLEGSGVDVVTDNYSASLTSSSADFSKDNIRKRAADFYNGLVGPEFYSPFTIRAPRFPPSAVIGLSRPLQRGVHPPQVQYVAIW